LGDYKHIDDRFTDVHLPPAIPGTCFLLALSAAQKFVINRQNDDLFIGTGLSPAPAAGDALESDQIVGTLIEVVAVDSTKWLQTRKVGAWTDVN
jgi:hypothetical protein